MGAFQKCLSPDCGATFDIGQVLHACPRCGDLLDVRYEWDKAALPKKLNSFSERLTHYPDELDFSGVWRFRELLDFVPRDSIITIGEGRTQLRRSKGVAAYVSMKPETLFLQYEGLNPSGSFKDNGMTAAFSHARFVGAKVAACASTGNTSASLACFAAQSELLKAVVFVGSGKVSYSKLSQTLDYGATTVEIEGDFDDAMKRVREICTGTGIYLMNSLNPCRLEGQKAIIYRILEGLKWEVPDWIVLPGGNLGNTSAFGKALAELRDLGYLKRLPRLAVVNAAGADTLYHLFTEESLRWQDGRTDSKRIDEYFAEMDRANRRAHTLASAIQINRPVNLKKALRSLADTNGVVTVASDEEILDAKAVIGASGLGCEPASAASVAGLKRLREQGVIAASDVVACVLTGHQLKDAAATLLYHSPDSSEELARYGIKRRSFGKPPVRVPNDIDKILGVVRPLLGV